MSRARRAAWMVWAVTIGLTLVWLPLVRLARTQEGDLSGMIFFPVFVIGFATVGALITSRQPRNRIGLAYALVALAGACALVAGAYAQLPFTRHIDVPGFRLAAWVGRVGFEAMALPLAFVFLLFPDGRPPTRRWRHVLRVMLVAAAINVVGYSITPGALAAGFTYTPSSVTNPLGAPTSWSEPIDRVTTVAGGALLIGAILGVASLVLRYRRSQGEERQQIRWLAYVGSAAIGLLVLGLLTQIAVAVLRIRLNGDALWTFTFFPPLLVFTIGTPAASLVAALKYRLWDLDVVIKKTVIAGALVVMMGVLAAAAIGVIGALALSTGTTRGASVAVGIAVGLLFVPALRLSRRIADRLVYGGRATPYEVLAEFSHRVAETYATEDVLPRMAAILAAGTGAERATIWLASGAELRPEVSSRADGAIPKAFPIGHAAERGAYEVRHLGDLLGAITVEMPSNDPMNPAKERLVRDLAAQAGPLLRNVKLIEDLRASRQRLVAAQDDERRKIERNIHDGAQQQLVALAVKLRLAEQLAGRDPSTARDVLSQLQLETNEALENLRDLARGIYPPLLAGRGLAAALEAQARRSPVPTTIDADGIGRFAPQIEATVYFCALEALQNVAKYADASSILVELEAPHGELTFRVSDDGRGFDASSTTFGTGLQGMADRLDAVGGVLEIRSALGAGTTIAGRLPARAS